MEGVVVVDPEQTEEGGMDEVHGLIRQDVEGNLLVDIIIVCLHRPQTLKSDIFP